MECQISGQKVNYWLPRAGGMWSSKEHGVSFWGDEHVLKLFMVMVAKFCECILYH